MKLIINHELIKNNLILPEFTLNSNGLVKIDIVFFEFTKQISTQKSIAKIESNKDFRNLHGKLLVQKLDDLETFIKEWRIFFVDTMNP